MGLGRILQVFQSPSCPRQSFSPSQVTSQFFLGSTNDGHLKILEDKFFSLLKAFTKSYCDKSVQFSVYSVYYIIIFFLSISTLIPFQRILFHPLCVFWMFLLSNLEIPGIFNILFGAIKIWGLGPFC